MIHPRIVQCFHNLGILIDENVDNFVINDFITDSLTYVSFIVELENEFSIEIGDEYLSNDALSTYTDIVLMIEDLSSLMMEIGEGQQQKYL